MICIALTQGQHAVVDNDDWELVSRFNWCATKKQHTFYAVANSNKLFEQRNVWLHRIIMGITDSSISIDHKDGNGLNNCRSNLRICDKQQNARNCKIHTRNTTGFKGVSFDKDIKKYRAFITLNGKTKHLGCFVSPVDAHAAYCSAAIKHYGEFARFE